jgi:uncharacterized Zn finger protein
MTTIPPPTKILYFCRECGKETVHVLVSGKLNLYEYECQECLRTQLISLEEALKAKI